MSIKEIFSFSKKKIILLAILLLSLTALTVWLNFRYISALDKKLVSFKNDTRVEILKVSDELAKLDPTKPVDYQNALDKLKNLNKDLSDRSKYEPGGFRPLLIRTGWYDESDKKLKDYQNNLRETSKILSQLNILAGYLSRLNSVIDPVIKLGASADAVNAQKQIETWQSSLNNLKNVKSSSAFDSLHIGLINNFENIVKYTKTVHETQASKDVNGFTAAHTELVKNYDAINKIAENLQNELKSKQKLLSQSGKKLL